MIHSAHNEFQVPSVLRLKRYVHRHHTPRIKFSRENIYRRDKYRCQYCGETFSAKDLTLDHVVPASKNGHKDWTNMVTACQDCNHRKGNRTPLAAGMPLLSIPSVPNWLPPIRKQINNRDRLPSSWLIYLNQESNLDFIIDINIGLNEWELIPKSQTG